MRKKIRFSNNAGAQLQHSQWKTKSYNMILIINDLIPLFFPEEHGLFKRLYFRFMSGRSARRANRILNVFESVLNQKIFLPEVFQWNM